MNMWISFIEIMKWRNTTRTLKGNGKQLSLWGIWVIGLNLGEILIKGKENLFQLAGNSSNPSLTHGCSPVTAKKITRG